jgi:hypothetical protein
LLRIGAGCLVVLSLLDATFAQEVHPFPPELVRWTPDPAASLFAGTQQDTWDRAIRERGWILRDESGLYHLFYTGYNGQRDAPKALGHATSTDGLHWTRDPANPLTRSGWVEDMTLVGPQGPDSTLPPGRWHLFAEGAGDLAHRLTSNDLEHWTDAGPLDIRSADGSPLSDGPRGTPVVLRDPQGQWALLYERGDRGVWLARSTDGLIWRNVQDDPVLTCGPSTYDSAAVALNQVLPWPDGHYYALYHANATRPWSDWTTCIARSRDLVHWEKYPGNPILRDNRSSAILVEGPEAGRWHLYTMHPEVHRYSNPPSPSPQR